MTTVLVIIIAAVIIYAVYHTVRKFRIGGGCCGEFEKSEKTTAVKDRNKAHYPHYTELKIGGMTCENCARRVENTLNSFEGIWAKVDLNNGMAKVYSKTEIDINGIRGIIAKAGYTVQLLK